MSELDYTQFDRVTLLKILEEVPVELRKRDKEIRQELRAKIQRMVQEEGYTLEEIYPSGKSKAVTRKAAPKYQHPDDPSITWTGRGRKPLWVVEATEEGGKTLEDLKIR